MAKSVSWRGRKGTGCTQLQRARKESYTGGKSGLAEQWSIKWRTEQECGRKLQGEGGEHKGHRKSWFCAKTWSDQGRPQGHQHPSNTRQRLSLFSLNPPSLSFFISYILESSRSLTPSALSGYLPALVQSPPFWPRILIYHPSYRSAYTLFLHISRT